MKCQQVWNHICHDLPESNDKISSRKLRSELEWLDRIEPLSSLISSKEMFELITEADESLEISFMFSWCSLIWASYLSDKFCNSIKWAAINPCFSFSHEFFNWLKFRVKSLFVWINEFILFWFQIFISYLNCCTETTLTFVPTNLHSTGPSWKHPIVQIKLYFDVLLAPKAFANHSIRS